jgi:uncharacterized membrane protein (TIGR02234 family)
MPDTPMSDTPMPDAAPRRPASKRGTARLAALLLLAAVALWAASRAPWVDFTAADALQPERAQSLSGAQWAGELGPLALALVAAAAAAFAVRGWAARALGVLVAVGGAVAAVSPVQALGGSPEPARIATLAELPARTEVVDPQLVAWAPVLAIAGAAAAVAAGAFLAIRPSRHRGLSHSYETPAARRDAVRSELAQPPNSVPGESRVPLTGRLLWDALDAGQDPTVDSLHDSAHSAEKDR